MQGLTGIMTTPWKYAGQSVPRGKLAAGTEAPVRPCTLHAQGPIYPAASAAIAQPRPRAAIGHRRPQQWCKRSGVRVEHARTITLFLMTDSHPLGTRDFRTTGFKTADVAQRGRTRERSTRVKKGARLQKRVLGRSSCCNS
jgi:hypothetical protein